MEIWDVYDDKREKTGTICRRDIDTLKNGEYHIVVTGIILNSRNEILIAKRAPHKKKPLLWECSGGSIIQGENSLQGILRELKEELGIEFDCKEAFYLKTIKDTQAHDFKDLWLFKRDIDIKKDLHFNDGEVIDAKWVSISQFLEMYHQNQIVDSVDFGMEEYQMAINVSFLEYDNYIGKKIKGRIDRPLGSMHPKHQLIYPINYGYIPETINGDGEEIDCYLLGENRPIHEFEGKCIAIIHRLNDNDDKLVISCNNENYTDEEIRNLTYFQEQYFKSVIVR